MVANATRVVFKFVHHLVHRQHLIAGERIDLRLIVRKGGALNGVAVVEQQGVSELLARLNDQGRDAFDADGFVLGQAKVVVAHHVAVQIGCLQQRDLGARAIGNCGKLRPNVNGASAARQL